MKKRKILIHSLRLLLGIIFIISAIAKYMTIDRFELYIFSQGIFTFDLSGIFARIIISAEACLGLLLLLNLYFRIVFRFSVITLIIFSIFLAFKMITAGSENCNCFGDLIEFNPFESLIKNSILILLLWCIRKNQGFAFRYDKIALIILVTGSLIIPSLLSPPDIIYRELYKAKYNIKPGQRVVLSDTTLGIDQGKKVAAFFSLGCKYCLLAAQKISIIASTLKLESEIVYIFFGDKINIDRFWEKSQSTKFRYTFLPFKELFEITGGHFPTILFLDSGYVKNRTGYRDLSEKQFEAHFQKNQ